MCGRMSHAGITWTELAGWMDGLRPAAADPDLRYNVPPTAMIPIIRRDGDALAGDFARWGLIPHWHHRPLTDWKANTINARVESVATAASYRDAYQRARCVVPASGYFEWQTTDGSQQPFYVHPSGNAPALLFAGLWSAVTLPDYEGLTCTVLTEPARTALVAIHDRMPVIIDPDGARTWLDGCEIGAVPRLPVAGLTWHAVPRAVGDVRNEGPELIEPIE